MDPNFEEAMDMAASVEVLDYGMDETIIAETNIDDIPMELEQMEETPILMDTSGGGEGSMAADAFIDQFTISTGTESATINIPASPANNSSIIQSTATPTFELKQIDGQTILIQNPKPNKVLGRPARQIAPAPKQVAIAPKPAPTPPSGQRIQQFRVFKNQAGNSTQMKKVTLTGVVQQKPMLAQVGKQLVMVPAGVGGQKIKIIPSGGQGQLQLSGKQMINNPAGKPVIMKLTAGANSQSVLSKIVQNQTSATQGTKLLTMHQKTVPISVGKGMVLSPTKTLNKGGSLPQVFTVQTPSASGVPNKKVLISANPAQSLIVKPSAQTAKPATPKTEGKQTQIHQIHVPGKGVQYIRLVTNSNAKTQKEMVINKVQQPKEAASMSRQTYIIDSKGNVVPLNASDSKAKKPVTPKQMVVTSGAHTVNKAGPASSKLVKIAPVTAKTPQQNTYSKNRLESLLAPVQTSNIKVEVLPAEEKHDTKAALRALIDSITEDSPNEDEEDNEDHHERTEAEVKQENWVPKPALGEHPLIVLPPNYYPTTPRQDRWHHSFEAAANPERLSPDVDLQLKPRKACNCNKSQCLKLYCDCFANGEFCHNCNCINCSNNLKNEEKRQKAIKGCLERNPSAFRPKIGKTKATGPAEVRRHNKGCNCKRSGCLKNYCECYEAKISCSSICKCVGCRNLDDHDGRRRREFDSRDTHLGLALYKPPDEPLKQPCMFMTSEVIEAVCQCLLAAGAGEPDAAIGPDPGSGEDAGHGDPLRSVIEEFSRCLQDIITASHQQPAEMNA